MTNPTNDREKRPSLEEILADLPEDQRKEAEERIEQYLEVAREIYEYACADPWRYADLQKLLRKEEWRRKDEEADGSRFTDGPVDK